MEFDSCFHSLLRNLKVDGPWTHPKTWESIALESGTEAPIDLVQGPQTTLYDLSSISEAILVRLVINALQGLRSSIAEIDRLSLLFLSSPADRSFHRVPNFWCRLSSTHAFGRMLKSISHSGLLLFFLRKFVSHFLCTDHNVNLARRDKNENCLFPSNDKQEKRETKEFPPYSLVNQAFAVAVGKLLDGYICALNTLSQSIKLRRSVQCKKDFVPTNHWEGTLTSAVPSEMTIMEVYLHTKELRSHIEALGSICISESFYRSLSMNGLSLNSILEFHDFPRGADLLSYLYVQFRDADPVHYSLLKYLFVHSYEPYSRFIKLWMYRATVDDPYEEFFVASSVTRPTTDYGSCSPDNFSLAFIKEQPGVSIPCFLKDVCHPLLLAGRQLQVLVKLLDFCDLSFAGEYVPPDLSILREILPFWVDSSSKLEFLSNPLIFDINGMDALTQKREVLYRTMLEKLHNYLEKFSAKARKASHNVIAFGSMPILLGGRSGMMSTLFPSVLDGESSMTHGNINEASGDADSNASSSSAESTFESELPLSSECSSQDYSNGSAYDLPSSLCQPSKSMFSYLPADHAKECILQTNTMTDCQSSHPPFDTPIEHVYHATHCSHHHHENRKMNQVSSCSEYVAIKDLKTSKYLTESCQSSGCWPLGGLQGNPFFAYMKSRGPQQLQLTESCFDNVDQNSDNFIGEEISFSEEFDLGVLNFDEFMKMQTSSWTFKSLSSHSSTITWPYAFSMNPMLTKTQWLPTVGNSRDIGFINNNASHFPNFNFSSVTDPCKLHSEGLHSGSGYRSKAETSMSVHSSGSVGGLEKSGAPIKAKVENQPITASLCYPARETNLPISAQAPNASGGADWTRSLKYPVNSATYSHGDIHLEEKFLVPLDIILDRCILQEILLQYKYISCFTIKLLEEGFNLQEHLLALRRYHFMEMSDWVDSFVILLSSQSALQHEQEPAKIQGLLDLALQRSSCENDPYKGRLFICTKERIASQSAIANGIHAFDFIVLGYQVDWPVNIVVTQGALKIYADIFSYLLRIRLAVTSLTDVWHYLKDLLHFLKHNQHKTFHEMENFNILMRMRQHINHFATTLQLYVQSQLSDVSWHQFQDSLKHMVKYMLDLESVHMLYLADAVRICFLSDDAKEVATIIKNILQSALDFHLCFAGIGFTGCLYEKDKPYLRSRINFTQVSIINHTFEKNMKELYLLCLQRPNDFGLQRFWMNLNYNDYFSTIINKEYVFGEPRAVLIFASRHGVIYNNAEGTMYLFAHIHLLEKAIEAAKVDNLAPEALCARRLLDTIGIVGLGSGFGRAFIMPSS